MAVPLKEGARLDKRCFLVEEFSSVPVVSHYSTAKTCASLHPYFLQNLLPFSCQLDGSDMEGAVGLHRATAAGSCTVNKSERPKCAPCYFLLHV